MVTVKIYVSVKRIGIKLLEELRTKGTYYCRRTEGRTAYGRTEGRKAENYVPQLFFEKLGDNKGKYGNVNTMSGYVVTKTVCHLVHHEFCDIFWCLVLFLSHLVSEVEF